MKFFMLFLTIISSLILSGCGDPKDSREEKSQNITAGITINHRKMIEHWEPTAPVKPIKFEIALKNKNGDYIKVEENSDDDLTLLVNNIELPLTENRCGATYLGLPSYMCGYKATYLPTEKITNELAVDIKLVRKKDINLETAFLIPPPIEIQSPIFPTNAIYPNLSPVLLEWHDQQVAEMSFYATGNGCSIFKTLSIPPGQNYIELTPELFATSQNGCTDYNSIKTTLKNTSSLPESEFSNFPISSITWNDELEIILARTANEGI